MNLFNLGAPSWLWEAINSLWLMLCKWIYIGINWFYQVFEKVASVNLFSTEVFKEITSRIYVVMGIAMLFIFAYNLILMIINPEDKKGSGAMGKVVKETMISLAVVVLLPTIFNYMYIVQSHILESNIIGQIIMGSVGSTTSDKSNCDSNDYDCKCDFSKFEELEQYNNTNVGMFWSSNYTTQGNQDLITKTCENYRGYNGSKITDSQRGAYSIAPTVFSAFYRPTNFTMEQCENYLINNDTSVLSNDKDQKICINYYFDVNMSKYTGNITPFVEDSYLNGIISDSTDKSMEFNWPFALIAGGLAVWMFICYAMEIGVRVAKLGLLQIISPIAVMMRVIPGQKEKIYDKWFTHLKNTYLDVFIRLVIIYFSLFAISLVPDVIKTLWISTVSQETASSGAVSGFFIKTLAMVVVILGILKFAQEAPALIKEFFGDAGRFSLKPKDVFNSRGIDAMRGAIYGATTGQGWGRIGGLFSGAARGVTGGYDKAVKGIDTIRTERANGSTFGGRMLDRGRTMIGMETRGESLERGLEKKFHTKERTELNDKVQKQIDIIKSTIDSKVEKEDSAYRFDVRDKETGQLFRYKGVNLSNLNYAGYQKYIASIQKDMEKETDMKKRMAMQQQILKMTEALEDSKKKSVGELATKAFNGDSVNGLFNGADLEKINSAKSNINISIKEGGVGVVYDDKGNKTTIKDSNGNDIDSEWTKQIDDGNQLFGKDSLRDRLTTQREDISHRSSEIQSGNYGKYQADSRMVRGQGKAEKK